MLILHKYIIPAVYLFATNYIYIFRFFPAIIANYVSLPNFPNFFHMHETLFLSQQAFEYSREPLRTTKRKKKKGKIHARTRSVPLISSSSLLSRTAYIRTHARRQMETMARGSGNRISAKRFLDERRDFAWRTRFASYRLPVPVFFLSPALSSLETWASPLVSSLLSFLSAGRAASTRRDHRLCWIGAWWRETRNEQAPHRPHSDTRDRFRARHPVVVATARSSRNRSRDLRPSRQRSVYAREPATDRTLTDMDSHLCPLSIVF